MKYKNIVRPALATLLILLIPFLGNQLVNGFNWDETDFIVMGALVFGTGFLIELVAIKVKNNFHRLAIIIAIVLTFLIIWAELGVGILTSLGS